MPVPRYILEKVTPPPLHHPATAVQVEDVDLLEVTPEMEAFLERYILKYRNKIKPGWSYSLRLSPGLAFWVFSTMKPGP